MSFRNDYRFPSTVFNFVGSNSSFEDIKDNSSSRMNMGNNIGLPTTVINFYGNEMPGNYNINEQSESSSSNSASDSDSDSGMDTGDIKIFKSGKYKIYEPPSVPSYPETTANYPFHQVTTYLSPPYSKITFETVSKIEMDIDFNDMISLIFLLCDSNFALQEIQSMVKNYQVNGVRNFVNDNRLSSWARYQNNNQNSNWRMELVEALAVIQNYRILEKLGYSRNEIDEQFQPKSNETLHLNRAKKMLFKLCDSLIGEQAIQLINFVRTEKKFDNDITIPYDIANMELHVLFWLTQSAITIDNGVNVDVVTKYLKRMNLSDIVERIEETVKKINEFLPNKYNLREEEDKNSYKIKNPKNVGLLIIVNMLDFENNVEEREEFKDQLPPCKLPNRTGSLEDVINLKSTFTKYLNFKVVIENDIKHDDLINEIQKMIRKHFVEEHSALFLCILSHGKEGCIYGVNSIPVRIEEIKHIFCNGTSVANMLINVPKVLIVQACQGVNYLYAEPGLTVDSPSSSQQQAEGDQMRHDGLTRRDCYSDLLVCMSIINGFVSVRSTFYGSKYIQELCRCLEKYYDKKHFNDIVVRVQRRVNAKDMHIDVKPEPGRCTVHKNCVNIYMTPWISCNTLRKDLYLTNRNQNVT
uniref:Caspase family p20 domain-containing protein n=2 Tax=Homalodisca liturata TaxID=320908 RepID=A0A1B6JA75_9HEMI